MIRLHHNCTTILQVSKRSASTGPAEANLHWSGLSAHIPECEARRGGGGGSGPAYRHMYLSVKLGGGGGWGHVLILILILMR